MAKNKNRSKNKGSALSKKEQRLNAKVVEMRKADDAAARERASRYYSPGSLGRLSSPEKIGAIGATTKVRDIERENANLNSSIAQSQQRYEESKARDAYVADALNRMKEGLAGFNTPELQAMREQGRREVMAQGRNTERALRQYAGASGLTGQALANEMRRTRRAVQGDIANQEVDLTVAQAAEQRARLNQYGTYANDAYQTHESVKDAALARLNAAQGVAAEYAMNADKANQGADATNASNEIDIAKTNADIQAKNITNATATETANLLQGEKELAGQIGIETGDPAVTEAYRARLTQEALAKEQIDAAKQGIGGSQDDDEEEKKR